MSNGLRIGEDESGGIVLNPDQADTALVFEVGEDGALLVRGATPDLELELSGGPRLTTLTIAQGHRLRVSLPNSIISLSSSLPETGSSGYELSELVVASLVPRLRPQMPLPARPRDADKGASVQPQDHAPAEYDGDREDPLHAEMILAEPSAEHLDDSVPTLSDAIAVEGSRLLSRTLELEASSASTLPESDLTTSEPYVAPLRNSSEAPAQVTAAPTADATPPAFSEKRRWQRLAALTAVVAAIAIAVSVLWEELALPVRPATGPAEVSPPTGSAVADIRPAGDAETSQARASSSPTPVETAQTRVIGVQPRAAAPMPDALPSQEQAPPALVTELAASTPVAEASAPTAEEVRLLADAQALFRQGAIVDPPGRNAVATLVTLLKLNPENDAAMALMFDCTNRLLDEARDAARSGDDFQARNIVEEVLAFHPKQPDALRLWEELVGRPYRRQ